MAKSKHRSNAKEIQGIPVDATKINLGNSYSTPPNYYYDVEFVCQDCGVQQVWTAMQQKWWYEEAGGYFFSIAIRCRPCRDQERQRKAEARQTHQSGILRENHNNG